MIRLIFLKKKIKDKEGFPIDKQRLIFKGKIMDDNLSLKQQDVNKEDTLHFVIKLDNRNNLTFQQLANNVGNVKIR